MLGCSRAIAVLDGRDYVIPEDVKGVAASVLAHRVSIKPHLWMSGVDAGSVVADVLRAVPAPDVSTPSVDTAPSAEAAPVGH